MNGKPTGAVRVSFGRMSRAEHVSKLVQVLKSAFLEVRPTIQVEQLPLGKSKHTYLNLTNISEMNSFELLQLNKFLI